LLDLLGTDLTGVVAGIDRALAAAILLTSFSLLAYVLSHNVYSPVGRAFAALLTFVTLVYVGDVAVQNVATNADAARWLRFQWVGIAFVPAAYLHLSGSLLRPENGGGASTRLSVAVGYAIGSVFLLMTLFGNTVVQEGEYLAGAPHLKAGPLFWLFTLYFTATTLLGAVYIGSARQRAMTRASRRRLTYLSVSFIAPTLGAFPFLVLAGVPGDGGLALVSVLSALANAAVLLMLVAMAYSVAFFGVLAPERTVKQSFIEYVLRGPFVGICVLTVMIGVPQRVVVLGLRREAFMVFAVVGVVVLLQVFISQARPLIDLLAYRQDRDEVAWLRELERRLLTSTDFRQVLEHVLISACDALRAEGGFIAALPQGDIGELRVLAAIGDVGALPQLPDFAGWLRDRGPAWQGRDDDLPLPAEDLLATEGYLVTPLLGRDERLPIGLMGVRTFRSAGALHTDELETLNVVSQEAVAAVEDMHLLQQVLDTLRRLLPEIESVQRWRGDAIYNSPTGVLDNPMLSPEFPGLVRGALRHYWGGPELRESPLLQLRVVRQAVRDNDGNPIKALRAVLVKAIEALRPPGQRDTSPEWMLYNVLEMKYVQGLKAKEIARRLAVSESDLYRKQRVAVSEVARVLAEMEVTAARTSDRNG
ncbi:MAG: histidine kinase N-terminal 7TM domain-containing protein, partial [Anaerolineae bacterium]